MTATSAAVALLATTTVSIAPAIAGTDTAPTTVPAAVPDDAEDKLTTAVEKKLDAGPADFWIDLATEADLSKAASIADWDERGQYVYDTLTSVAESSQADLVKALDAAGTEYEPFWISNRILVSSGSRDLAVSLAGSPEVAAIHEPTTLELVEPVKTRKTTDHAPDALEWGVEAINADDVWDLGYTGEGITVGSIDTGAQYDHPALADHYRGMQPDGSIDHDYNWFDSSGGCATDAPCDNNGHGSHVTGTMVGDDGAGNQIGVAPGAEWIAANGCDTCSDADLMESGQWILAPTAVDGSAPDPAQRPHVINNSWGLNSPGAIDDFMADEIAAWEAAGIWGAWSAGNEGPSCQTTSSPGANVATYAVGASDVNGDIASFSSRGTGEGGEIAPNIAAPGVAVRSSVPGDGYSSYNGTSMASPHLAGAVALLWSAAPALVGDIEGTRALLNSTAVDVDDTTCGGTAENNNVWGEGMLDALALVEAAPIGATGTATGVVSGDDGAPVEGATVTFTGDESSRTTTTDAEGAYSVRLAVGEYTAEASAFGFLDSEPLAVSVTEDTTLEVPITLEAAPSYALSGTVTTDATGDAVEGAVVELSAPIDPVTTGPDGAYAFDAVPQGTYTVSITSGGCAAPFSTTVELTGDTVVDAPLAGLTDAYGYYCTVGSEGAATGDTLTSLSGDDGAVEIDLPFSFPFYGEQYDTAWATTNGFLNFLSSSTTYSNGEIPSSAAPNAAIYPFWDDLRFDEDAALYTGETTVDGLDAFVLEWRAAPLYTDGDSKATFSVTLVSNGVVVLGYGDQVGEHANLTGLSATVGIENAAGDVASQYSYNAAAVTPGLSIRYDLGDMGSVTGKIRDANTRDPLEGATVTITSRDDGDVEEVTTAADGTYSAMLPLERYDVLIEADGYEPATRAFRLTEDGQVRQRNAALAAGMLTVNKESISASPAMGGTASRGFRVTNSGSAPVDVELAAGGGVFELLGGDGAGVIRHVDGKATVPGTGGPSFGTTGSGLGTADGKNSVATSGASTKRYTPEVVLPDAETVLTHSASQDIIANNSAACTNGLQTQDNGYLRTFTLDDFGIDGAFDVSHVSFAVEAVDTAQPLTVRLYTLDGDLVYANLTEVGSAETTVGTDAAGTIVTVPVTGEIPAGSTLVVELDVPAGGWFFAGSNDAGQTAPTYLRSEGCGMPEPTDTAEVGFPGMHLVMNVAGETAGGGGGGVEWLDVQPATFTLEPGQTVRAGVTLDASVDQPGDYSAVITASGATPYADPTVAATMSVKAPRGWGKVAGTVTGDGSPLDGAVVHMDGLAFDVTLVTGGDGTYQYWMPRSNGPLQMIVAANGHIPTTFTAQVVGGQTTVYDVDLDPLP